LQECDIRISNATRPNIRRLISMEDASSLAVFASRLLNGNAVVSSIDGIAIFAQQSSSAPTIQVEDCEIDAQRAIVMANGGVTAAFWQSVSFNRNKIVHRQTASTFGIDIRQAKSLLFCDNIIRGSGTEVRIDLGASSADADTQETAIVARNQLLFVTGAGSLTLEMRAVRYANPVVNDNIIRRGGGTGTSAISVEVTGNGGLNAQCCGNEITVTNAGVISGNITLTDYVLATANRNSIRLEATTNNSVGQVTLVSIARNGLANENNIAAVATGAFSATARVQAAGGGSGVRLAASNNQLQAETGGAGTATAEVLVQQSRQGVARGNQCRADGGPSTAALVTFTTVSRSIIGGNSLDSDVTAEINCIYAGGGEEALLLGNTCVGDAVAVQAIIGNGVSDAVRIRCDENIVYANGTAVVNAVHTQYLSPTAVGSESQMSACGNTVYSATSLVQINAIGTASSSVVGLGVGNASGNNVRAFGNVTIAAAQLRATTIVGNAVKTSGSTSYLDLGGAKNLSSTNNVWP
jgi:hypothetical protein